MFLHMSVILFTAGGGGWCIPAYNGQGVSQNAMGQGVWPGGVWPGCVSVSDREVCDQRGCMWPGGYDQGCVCDQGGARLTPHYGHQAGSMHPTGKLSCLKLGYLIQLVIDASRGLFSYDMTSHAWYTNSRGSRISLTFGGGGLPTLVFGAKSYYLTTFNIFAKKTAWTWKKNWTGHVRPIAPLGSANDKNV